MPITTADFTNFTFPGVQVIERQDGFRILESNSFNHLYLFGTASTGVFGKATDVNSVADFKNQFPGSLSEPMVTLAYMNNPRINISFIRVGIASTFKLTVTSAAAGTLNVTINGTLFTVTITGTDTVGSVASTLLTAINSSLAVSGQVTAIATAVPAEILVISDSFTAPVVITAPTANITADDQNTGVLAPRARDYAQAIANAFSVFSFAHIPQGFVAAPEAFNTLTLQSDRALVGNALVDLAELADWFAIIDKGANVTKIADLQIERNAYASTLGHGGFYGSYGFNSLNQKVPLSTVVAAIATRRGREEGIRQPFAGIKYRLKGVVSLDVNYSDNDQSLLNPNGINLVRNIEGYGICIWGMRTISVDSNYVQQQGRIVMNVLNGTLRGIPGLYAYLFESIDSAGVYMGRLRETILSYLHQLWLNGSLYGDTPDQAYAVVCDDRNNPPEQLQLGNVYAAVYAAVSPASEKILINTIKMPIGQIPDGAESGLNQLAA